MRGGAAGILACAAAAPAARAPGETAAIPRGGAPLRVAAAAVHACQRRGVPLPGGAAGGRAAPRGDRPRARAAVHRARSHGVIRGVAQSTDNLLPIP